MTVKHKYYGFSLIESVIFIVIVGIAITGTVTLFTTNVSHSHEPLLRQKAISLANMYMDEILRKKWNEATPNGGGRVAAGDIVAIGDDGDSRAAYDDIDDYHNLSDNPPKDQTGTDLNDFSGYSVTVSVTEPSSAWHSIPAADVRKIEVSVTTPMSETISLVAYRSNF
ncbi:type II secretion system protein [Ectothiorhodospiraceae bacterium BW-2]|nr:type II secretion system protein [Ectothiorhodospiraceae bacterium BW-2]